MGSCIWSMWDFLYNELPRYWFNFHYYSLKSLIFAHQMSIFYDWSCVTIIVILIRNYCQQCQTSTFCFCYSGSYLIFFLSFLSFARQVRDQVLICWNASNVVYIIFIYLTYICQIINMHLIMTSVTYLTQQVLLHYKKLIKEVKISFMRWLLYCIPKRLFGIVFINELNKA